MLRVACAASPSGRSISRTKTARSPAMKVGTPQTSWSWTPASCSCSSCLSTAGSRASSSTRPPVEPGIGEHAGEHRGVLDVAPGVVAGGEQPAVDGEEVVGVLVADDQPDGERQDARLGVRLVADPDVRLALGDVALRQAVGREGDVPVGAGLERRDDVLVGVAGERAQVVEGHGEAAGHGGSRRRVREAVGRGSSTGTHADACELPGRVRRRTERRVSSPMQASRGTASPQPVWTARRVSPNATNAPRTPARRTPARRAAGRRAGRRRPR